MWFDRPLAGNSAPARTICLTFDDGPGSPTAELGDYLREQKIRSAFFVVGRHVQEFPDVADGLQACGHTIGNHSFHHPPLTASFIGDDDVLAEVLKTDNVLPAWPPWLFRPPYGAWSPHLAQVLNTHPKTCLNHVGPIHWDLDGRDFEYWRDGRSPESCAARYLEVITKSPRQNGIVLCHDRTADSESISRKNRTFEMIQILVPRLRELGFDFISLPDIPRIREGLRARVPFILRGATGCYLPASATENLEPIPLVAKSIAFRAADGRYLSCGTGLTQFQMSTSLGAAEVFQFCYAGSGSEPVSARRQ